MAYGNNNEGTMKNSVLHEIYITNLEVGGSVLLGRKRLLSIFKHDIIPSSCDDLTHHLKT